MSRSACLPPSRRPGGRSIVLGVQNHHNHLLETFGGASMRLLCCMPRGYSAPPRQAFEQRIEGEPLVCPYIAISAAAACHSDSSSCFGALIVCRTCCRGPVSRIACSVAVFASVGLGVALCMLVPAGVCCIARRCRGGAVVVDMDW